MLIYHLDLVHRCATMQLIGHTEPFREEEVTKVFQGSSLRVSELVSSALILTRKTHPAGSSNFSSVEIKRSDLFFGNSTWFSNWLLTRL